VDHDATFGKTIEGLILQKLHFEIKAHIRNVQTDIANSAARERELS